MTWASVIHNLFVCLVENVISSRIYLPSLLSLCYVVHYSECHVREKELEINKLSHTARLIMQSGMLVFNLGGEIDNFPCRRRQQACVVDGNNAASTHACRSLLYSAFLEFISSRNIAITQTFNWHIPLSGVQKWVLSKMRAFVANKYWAVLGKGMRTRRRNSSIQVMK